MSSSRISSDGISNQILEDRNLISIKEEAKEICIAKISTKRIHWANRDFSEYKKAA